MPCNDAPMHQHENFNPYAPPTANVDQGLQTHGEEYVLAERGTRLGAAIIDGLLMVAALLPGFLLMGVMTGFGNFGSSGMLRGGNSGAVFLGFGMMGLMFLAFMGYQWYLISTTGQSLAKRWLGIKIVRVDGSEAGFVHGVILRSWVLGAMGQIPIVGPLVSLVDPLLIFGEERRCLHDQIAGTRVIVAPIQG